MAKYLNENLDRVIKSAHLDRQDARIVIRDVVDFLKTSSEHPYDLIFLDPPYNQFNEICSPIFSNLRKNNFIHSKLSFFMKDLPGSSLFMMGGIL